MEYVFIVIFLYKRQQYVTCLGYSAADNKYLGICNRSYCRKTLAKIFSVLFSYFTGYLISVLIRIKY